MGIDEPLDDLEGVEDEAAAEREQALLRRYVAEIARLPRLTREEEHDLAERAGQGDEKARRQLIEGNLLLVLKLARRYSGRGLALMDLIEEGNIGLMRATTRYRPDRGTRFATYAAWWVRQAITRSLQNQTRLIRLPVQVEALLGRYLKAREDVSKALGRPAMLAEVAARLSVAVEDLAPFEDEAPMIRPGPAWGELLSQLRPKERLVLECRFGLNGREPMTLEAIGRDLRLTRERIRQIEASGLRALRSLLKERGGQGLDFFA